MSAHTSTGGMAGYEYMVTRALDGLARGRVERDDATSTTSLSTCAVRVLLRKFPTIFPKNGSRVSYYVPTVSLTGVQRYTYCTVPFL